MAVVWSARLWPGADVAFFSVGQIVPNSHPHLFPLRFFMSSSSTRILLMTVVLLAIPAITVAESIPRETSAASPVTPSTGVWRRTSQGWQRTSHWPSRADRPSVTRVGRVHPLVLALLIGLISLGGLIGFGPPRRR